MTKKCKKCGWSRVIIYVCDRYSLQVDSLEEQIGSDDVQRINGYFESTQGICAGCGHGREDISHDEIDDILEITGIDRSAIESQRAE